MTRLDAVAIREAIGETAPVPLAELDVFSEIESTNSHLMQQPAPAPGEIHVAATDNQTAGRGRHGRTWRSPPGSGLCLSMAYTFYSPPANLPALTLAIGLGAIDALHELGAAGLQLKWPNDLIAADGKLGGILTETHSRTGVTTSVVTGIGLNIDLSEHPNLGVESNWAEGTADLKGHVANLPGRNVIAAGMINSLGKTFVNYDAGGFSHFVDRWPDSDWLFGREFTVDTPKRKIAGIGAGVADDGALLVDTPSEGVRRVTSGSVLMSAA